MGLLGDRDGREEGRMEDVIQVGLEGGWTGGDFRWVERGIGAGCPPRVPEGKGG